MCALRVPHWLALAVMITVSPFGMGRLAAADPAKPFRAGAFAMDITPQKFPISVNGGMQDRQANGAHDRLHARCLVLDDGATRIAIAVCDSCMIPRELLDEAKRQAANATGIPAERMLIAATHTHTAPTVAGVFQSDPDKDYQKYLSERIAAGIVRANANLAPARAGWAVARDPTQVFNRRWKMKPGAIGPDPFGGLTDTVKMNPGYKKDVLVEPAGPIDPEVAVLAVQTPEGQPITLLANYSLHYVGGSPPLSADYFGAFCERIGVLLKAGQANPPFVGIMSNGTSGNINNINYSGSPPGKRGESEQIRLVSNSVAQAAFEAYQRIEFRTHLSLAMAEKEIELGVRKPTDADVAKARDILAKAPSVSPLPRGGEGGVRGRVLKTQPEIYARETVLLADYPAKVRVKLQAIRIGDLGIAAIPCETFVETGLEIKKKSPLKPTFTIELANGYNGYLPTPEHHQWGGYETWRARSSYLAVDAEPKIRASVLELLGQARR